MKKVSTLILGTLLLGLIGCSTQGYKVVDAVNNEQFKFLAHNMPKQFQSLRITDSQNNWFEQTISLPTLKVGETLYSHLATDFIYSQGENTLPAFFSQMNGTNVMLENTYFSLKRGTDTFKGELIAEVDWNDDGNEDWLVLFSIKAATSIKAGRDFYLLITDTKQRPLVPQTIAIKDYLDNSFKALISPDLSTSEYDIGTNQLIEAPNDDSKKENNENSQSENVNQMKLSN